MKALKDPDNVFFELLEHLSRIMGKFGFSVFPKVNKIDKSV